MNRPVNITHPNNYVITNVYNKGGLLEQVKRGSTEYISNIDYNARGQRTKIVYGNGSETTFTYNEDNFRLTRLLTTRNTGNDILQDLNYTYDSVGNIVEVEDDAQQTIYFNNNVIDPVSTYEYDALYRLVEATGRELTSLQMPTDTDFVNNIPVPNTGSNAMQTYTQQYSYDKLGNILQMRSVNHWTRNYYYDTATNRLLKHEEHGQNEYTYDAHGNMLTMPHLTNMVWDYKDELISASNGTVNSFYNYDAEGNRTRKVVVKPGGIIEERYYLDGYEVYRKYLNNNLDLERKTINVYDVKLFDKNNDDKEDKGYSIDKNKKFAIVDIKTVENGTTLPNPNTIIRYQYDNHLGSACLELDNTAAIISYEEYHPFGTTSYRSGRNEVDVSLKRYKYIGKERDEETGLYYFGARYYAGWIGRWISVDLLKEKHLNLSPYNYCANNSVNFLDPDGKDGVGHIEMRDGQKTLVIEATYLTNYRVSEKTQKLVDKKMNAYKGNVKYKGEKVKVEFDIKFVQLNLDVDPKNVAGSAISNNFNEGLNTFIYISDLIVGETPALGSGNRSGIEIDMRFGLAGGLYLDYEAGVIVEEIGHNIGFLHSDGGIMSVEFIKGESTGNMTKRALQKFVNRLDEMSKAESSESYWLNSDEVREEIEHVTGTTRIKGD